MISSQFHVSSFVFLTCIIYLISFCIYERHVSNFCCFCFNSKILWKKSLIFSQETNIKCTKKSFRFAFLMWLLLLLSWIIIFFLFNLNQNQLLWFRVWWNFISSDEHRHHVNVIWSDIRQWYDAMSHNVEEDFLRILYILYNNNSRLY